MYLEPRKLSYNDELFLLHGFIKKTQKTSRHELELAKRRKKEMEVF